MYKAKAVCRVRIDHPKKPATTLSRPGQGSDHNQKMFALAKAERSAIDKIGLVFQRLYARGWRQAGEVQCRGRAWDAGSSA